MSTVIQAYRFALDPTTEQEIALRSHCGGQRFAFNWGLALVRTNLGQRDAEATYGLTDYQLTPLLSWSAYNLRKFWNTAKGDVAAWWRENSKEAYSSGLANLATALGNWSDSKAGKRAGPKIGFPRFKSKRAGLSCRFTTGAFGLADADRRHVKLPRVGTVRTHESTRKLARHVERASARIRSATVTHRRGRWFVSFSVEITRHDPQPARPDSIAGVDLGVKSPATSPHSPTTSWARPPRVAGRRKTSPLETQVRPAHAGDGYRHGKTHLHWVGQRRAARRRLPEQSELTFAHTPGNGYQGGGNVGKDAAMGRVPYHHHPRWSLARRPFGSLLVLLCAAALASAGLIAVALVAMLFTVVPLMLAGVGAVTVARHVHRRRAGSRQDRAMAPPRPPSVPGPPPAPDWQATRARFTQLRSEYGQFECDPLAVLRLPALTDVAVPSTGRFVDAFAEAQALETDTEPPAAHHARFATAVEQAWRAWHAARDAAERIRLAGIPAPERATVQRAIKLLTMARDSDHDAERIAAYAKARAELAKLDRSGILRLPPAAAAALDVAARGQLPPAAAS